jgi:hypothetical protein
MENRVTEQLFLPLIWHCSVYRHNEIVFAVFPVVAGLTIGVWIMIGSRPSQRLLRILVVDTKNGDYTLVPTSSNNSRQIKSEQGPSWAMPRWYTADIELRLTYNCRLTYLWGWFTIRLIVRLSRTDSWGLQTTDADNQLMQTISWCKQLADANNQLI